MTLLPIDLVQRKWEGNQAAVRLLTAAAAVCTMAFAYLLRGEYVFLGILIVALFYLLRQNRSLQLFGIAPLLSVSPYVLLALIPLYIYNGTRGKGSKIFFYVFYPTHFLLFAAAAYLISNR